MNILSWLFKTVVLDWLFNKIKSWYEDYMAKKDRDKKIEEEVKKEVDQIKQAETEDERKKAISDIADGF